MTTRHPTVTDEGRRLLEGATPGPWSATGSRIHYRGPGGGFDVLAENEMLDRNNGLAKVNTTGRASTWEADAALIVYAVNRLPAFLAAVEALRELYDEVTDGWGDDYTDAMRTARAALAPFTEEPTDD